MNTYYLNLRSQNIVPTTETILPTVNTPYIEQASLLGIMNNHGSDSIIRVREIQINELIGRTTTAVTALDLWRITALVGGEVVSSIPYDSTASALPSQISIVKHPNSVTTTGSYIRRMLTKYGLSLTGALLWHFGVAGGSRSGGMNLNHLFNSGDSEAQKIVLREGQGIALRTNLTSPQNFSVELTVHFSDGTNTRVINEVLNIQSATELFAILNGSGSGIVMEIQRIEMRLIRTADIPFFTIESFSDMYGGTSLTPISMDSANASIDSLVEFKQNASVLQGNIDAMQGRNSKQGGDLIPLRRLVQPTFGKGVALASGALQIRPITNKPFHIDRGNNEGEFTLREGEGLGIFQRVNGSGMGNYEFNIMFTVEDNGGVVSGGESSYVF